MSDSNRVHYYRRLRNRIESDFRHNARYFRLGLRRASAEQPKQLGDFSVLAGDDMEDVSPRPVPIEPAFTYRIKAGDPRMVLGRPEFCIYCGAPFHTPSSSRPPSDEHIIPEGIGGNLVLERASCQNCADKINNYEGSIQRSIFHATRGRLGLRGKKHHHKQPFRVTTIVDGEETEIDVPIDTHPSMLVMPKYRPPGLVELRPDSIKGVDTIWTFYFDTVSTFGKSAFSQILTPELDSLKFAQLLAKIAYSYLATIIPIESFSLERRPIMKGEESWLAGFATTVFDPSYSDESCYARIGSSLGIFERSSYLHEIGHGVIDLAGVLFDVIYIRLFANLGAPLYVIVVNYGFPRKNTVLEIRQSDR